MGYKTNGISAQMNEQAGEQISVVYSRVSTPFQRDNSTGSINYQKAMRQRLIDLGIDPETIVDFDDLGISGSYGIERDDFEHLKQIIFQGKVTAVAISDLSRLGRSAPEVGVLVELCATKRTIILTASRAYSPWIPEDLAQLGMLSVFSNYEWHSIREKMQSGRLDSVNAGRMKIRLPLGYRYNHLNQIIQDEDEEIKRLIKRVFKLMKTFQSAYAVTRELIKEGFQMITLHIERDPEFGINLGTYYKTYSKPTSERVRSILSNPTYAGAYTWGKKKYEKVPISITKSKVVSTTIRDYKKWTKLKLENHEGYISWQTYTQNVKKLMDNSYSSGSTGAPREGNALLQGKIFCGKCKARLEVHYGSKIESGEYVHAHSYRCVTAMNRHSEPVCQSMVGYVVEDEVIRQLLVVASAGNISDLIFDAADTVESDSIVLSRLRRNIFIKSREVQRKQEVYDEAIKSGRNPTVITALLDQWDAAQTELDGMNEQLNTESGMRTATLPVDLGRIATIPVSLQNVMNDPAVAPQHKKLLIQALISKVIVIKSDRKIHIKIEWQSGYFTSKQVEMRKHSSWKKSPEATIEFILSHRPGHTFVEIARMLNEQGFKSFSGQPFKPHNACSIYHHFKDK